MRKTPETLTELLAARIGEGRELSYREFETRAVGKEGYRPSRNTLWKIVHGENVQMHPALVAALAVGLGLPEQRVQAAAAFQYTGYVAAYLAGGTAVHEDGADVADMPRNRRVVEKWDEEED